MKWTVHYLLDTDICIYLLNGNQQIKEQVTQVGIESLAVATITKGELYFGAYNSNRIEANLKRVQNFFMTPGPQVLPLDDEVMDYFGKFKAELRGSGQIIGDIDILIASVAVSNNLTLVTNNIRHFERISELSLENWLNDSTK